jgi:putative heme-binding domain-containing protein
VLESIVMPSRVVAEAFRVHQLELRDGSSLVGLVERRADGARRIRVEDGTERTVSPGDLVRDEPLAGSAMPEGLLSSLTFEEAADLLEYLASLR